MACLLLALNSAAGAAERPVLRVGISPLPPLVFSGTTPARGFDISLWESVADQLGVQTRYETVNDFATLLERVSQGELDVAMGGISITATREMRMDFSHPYLRSGLGILTTSQSQHLLEANAPSLSLSQGANLRSTITLLLILAGVLLASSVLFWWIELRHDHSHRNRPLRSLIAALYWSVVTMSTVGYGDYAPKKAAGKMLALLLIFSGIGLFGAVVAHLSSVLTLAQLEQSGPHPRSLRGSRVGTLAASAAIPVVRHFGGIVATYPSLESAIRALELNQVEAVVSEWPVLYYVVSTSGKKELRLSDGPFDEQLYAFALPTGSPWREPINMALLRIREDGVLARLTSNFFGDDFRLNNVVADE